MKNSKRVSKTPVKEEVSKKTVKKKHQPPATTVDGRERQLIGLTIALAEKQIRAGTASSQVMTHFLKLGSTLSDLEKEKLKKENLLLQAKTESLKSSKRSEELLENALSAFGIYSGKNQSQESKKILEERDDS